MNNTKFPKMNYPFTAISAQENFKLALILCMIDGTLGGVLALGDKGTGKTTTVRSLTNLMSRIVSDFSFVNLPIGATEDRVLGSVKLDVLINDKKIEIQKGLLSKANQGVLYIDEINLLNDYLMDILLDASSSGGYFLERDSISQWQESNFCLVGTMNPEEGDLRPQLLDRFGLCVEIKTPNDKVVRIEIANRRLNFDTNEIAFTQQFEENEEQLANQIKIAKTNLNTISISDSIHSEIAEICIEHKVEGLRADILLLKAARAYASFNNKTNVETEDVHRIKDFVLLHRSKKENQNESEKENNKQNEDSDSSSENESKNEDSGLNDYLLNATKTDQFLKMNFDHKVSSKGVKLNSDSNVINPIKNSFIRNAPIHFLNTIKHFIIQEKLEINYKTIDSKTELEIVFLIDSTSSMIQNKQIAYVKGIIEQTINRNKSKKLSYSAIAMINGSAIVLSQRTSNVDDLILSICQLKTGGKTNLKAGLKLVYSIFKQKKSNQYQLFILTDGQINVGETENPFNEAVNYYKKFIKSAIKTSIVDMEKGFVKLGLARQLASQFNCKLITF